MPKEKKHSFRKRLLLSYIGASCLALCCLSVFFFAHTASQVQKTQFQELENGAHAIANALDSYMSSIDTLLSTIHADSIVQSYLRNQDTSIAQSDVHTVIIMQDMFSRRTNSIQVFASNRPDLSTYKSASQIDRSVFSDVDVKTEEWYKLTERAGGRTCWYYTEHGGLDNKPYYYVSRLIYNTQKLTQTLGVIRVCVSMPVLQNLLDLSFYSDGYSVLVVDGKAMLSTLEGFQEDEKLTELIANQGNSNTLQNSKYFAASVDAAYKGWSVLVLLPRKVFLEKEINYLLPIFIMSLVMLVVTLIYSSRFSAYLARPVRSLYDKMIQFGRVNDISIDENTDEEIAYLYKAFNAMIRKINVLLEQEKENEVRMLQSQINPHFVYNTLESLRGMASVRGANDISDMIGIFGTYFRECLNDGRFYCTIDHEIQHASSYLQIQSLRYQDLFTWEINIDERVHHYYVPHAILQPLIENSIIHGFDGMTEGGLIRIEGYEQGPDIVLTVSDNGCGADPEEMNTLLRDGNEQDFSCIHNIWMRLKRFSSTAEMHYEMGGDGRLTVLMRFEKKASLPEGRKTNL